MDPVLLWELFSNSVQYLEGNAINYMWIMSSGHYWQNVVTLGKKARPRTLSQTQIYPILLQHNTKNYIHWKEVGKLYTSLEVKSTDLAYDRQTHKHTVYVSLCLCMCICTQNMTSHNTVWNVGCPRSELVNTLKVSAHSVTTAAVIHDNNISLFPNSCK